MSLASIAIKRPSFIVSLVVVMLTIGVISYNRLGVDLMPDITFPMVMVMTPYSGAGPQEVETMVSKPLEEELNSLSGIDHLFSVSQEGMSLVMIQFVLGTDIKIAEQKVRDKVATVKATKLPREVDEPIFRLMDTADTPIYRVSLITQGLRPAQIYDLAKNGLKPLLEKVNDVANIEISGGTEREIDVLLDRNKLKNREISLTSVAGRIGANSQNVPVGKVAQSGKQMLFRTLGEYRSLDQIRESAVNFFGSDNPVAVQDVGEVVDTVEEAQTYAYYNGDPAVFIDVFKQSGANTVAVAEGLVKAMDKFNQDYQNAPGHPHALVVVDMAKPIRLNLDDVKQAILIGVILTLMVVYFFLGSMRSTLITIVALPNSLIGGFIMMYLMGFTLNVISLMALSMAVGLLIDDAIVVRENIWRHIEMGQAPKLAAIAGTHEVTLAVVSTTSVIMAVFMPVGLMGGISGMFFKQMGFTVVFAMGISLFDAMTMAPLLSAYLAGKGRHSKDEVPDSEKMRTGAALGLACGAVIGYTLNHWTGLGVGVLLGTSLGSAASIYVPRFINWLIAAYERVIAYCLDHRLLVLMSTAGAVVIFFASVLFFVKFSFLPNQDNGMFQVSLKAPSDISLEGMRDACLDVEKTLRANHKEIAKTALLVGSSQAENNIASIYVELVDFRQRTMNTTQMQALVRKDLLRFPGLTSNVGAFQLNSGFGSQSPFALLIMGDDFGQMEKIARQAAAAFKSIPDLADLDVDYDAGKPEIQVVMDPTRMRALGVSAVTAGMELRGLIDGLVAAKFRDGMNDYDIRVRLKEGQRDLREGLQKFYIPNMNFNLVRLSDVGTSRASTGPTKINRRDRQRYILISAQLNPGGALGTAQAKANKILADMNLPKDIHTTWSGQGEWIADMVKNILLALGLAILFIYLVLVSLYESTIQPVLIMLALPLAVVGAFMALALTRISVDMFSLIGFIMLLGLVAKNSILLVDYANQQVRKGMDRKQALILAGKVRLRPILMTTIALIAGMLPLALALSEVSKFRQGMGVAVIGGLISSTLLSLVVIPTCYEYFDDARHFFRRLFGRPELREIDIEERQEAKADAKTSQKRSR